VFRTQNAAFDALDSPERIDRSASLQASADSWIHEDAEDDEQDREQKERYRDDTGISHRTERRSDHAERTESDQDSPGERVHEL
jgi:hypothetical protein